MLRIVALRSFSKATPVMLRTPFYLPMDPGAYGKLAVGLTLAKHGRRGNRRTHVMSDPGQRIVIVDLRIPFIRLVLFFVKVALAAIPAAIIFGVLLMVATALVAALTGDGGMMMRRWSF